MILQCLVVDDEPLAQDVLENYIERTPGLALVKKCSNAIQANAVLHKHHVDLIFLDIQMPEINGVEFMKSLKNAPAVIFTTAFSKYAVEGFNLDAMDYLLKPISFDRFLKAVNKVMDYFTLKQKNTGSSLGSQNQSNELFDDFMFVKADKKMVKINYKDMFYIEGLKDYVMIYTTAGRIITLMTMKSLEEKLPDNRFVRIHRSFIIAMDKVKSISGNAVEINEKHLPIGKLYREPFMSRVDKYNMVK